MATKQASKPAAKRPATKPVTKPTTTAVAVRRGPTDLALSGRLKERATRQREELAKFVTGGTPAISFRGGTMRLGNTDLGHEIPVIVLAAKFERSYYPSDYDAEKTPPPSCYSRESGPTAKPHPNAAFPQAELCMECAWNEFKSARQGKGKACREGYRMIVVHADQAGLDTPPPVAVVRFSVLNSKDVQKAISGIYSIRDDDGERAVDHLIQVRCILTCHSDPDRMIMNTLAFDGYNSPEVVNQLEPMIDDAEGLLDSPYPTDGAVDPEEAEKASKARPAKKTTRRF